MLHALLCAAQERNHAPKKEGKSMFNTIKQRILVGYALVIIVAVIAAFVLTQNNNRVETLVDTYVSETLPSLNAINNIQSGSKELVLIAYSLYGTTLDTSQFDARKKDIVASVSAQFSTLSSSGTSQTEKQFDNLTKAILSLQNTMSASSISWDTARDNLAEITAASDALNKQMNEVRASVERAASNRTMAISSELNTSEWIIVSLIVLLLIVSVVGYVLAKLHIANPIESMALKLNELASSRRLATHLPGQQLSELDAITKSVQGLLSVFLKGMQDLQVAVNDLNHSSKALNGATSHSASAISSFQGDIKQLVSVMDTLSGEMEQSLHLSQQAAKEAQGSAEQVAQGRDDVAATARAISDLTQDIDKTASTLDRLQNDGKNVSNVVSTIAEIADQTNLLALNAAIEAARAGESGRGFAVVADEVRTLASRTHQSTVEINTMLETIVESIKASVRTMTSNKDKAHNALAMANDLVTTLENGRQSILSLVKVSNDASDLVQHAREQVTLAREGVLDFQMLGDDVKAANNNVNSEAQSLAGLATELQSNVNTFKLN
jgi:methyl-accepting chemotaxis protein